MLFLLLGPVDVAKGADSGRPEGGGGEGEGRGRGGGGGGGLRLEVGLVVDVEAMLRLQPVALLLQLRKKRRLQQLKPTVGG